MIYLRRLEVLWIIVSVVGLYVIYLAKDHCLVAISGQNLTRNHDRRAIIQCFAWISPDCLLEYDKVILYEYRKVCKT
jgi:hypothetical protein